MNKYILIFCSILIPTFVFADLPSSHFMKKAFQINVINKWYKAKGVLMLQDADGWPEIYKVYERADESSRIIREFTIKNRKRSGTSTEEYAKQSQVYIGQLPLFVSTHGYDEQVPGYAIFIPIMDIQNKWASIYIDWNAEKTGWIKMKRNYFLFDNSAENIWHFKVESYYYPGKKTLLRPAERNNECLSIDASSAEIKSSQMYKNDQYLYVPRVTKIQQNKIFITWDNTKYFLDKEDDYIFKWVYWPVGD